ncbi:MAG: FAD-binding oxidoreductase [endosymbiont of Galathealinum brachiosum]|uniref:FAD-binding oxidoreductase n=1 Tax=endosymbiont of Galathealinum brachiosum TaxID=2200906 RepID=A0A370D8V8_9GAMM|nr:MAG: FAD-binding oxidoreductase [endosymbiont of Galathealinum brachiosum]
MSKPFLKQLQKILPTESILTDASECLTYGYDNSRRHAQPLAVVFPTTEEHVQQIITICNQHNISLYARGRGTGTTGATVPVNGGIVISFEHMNKIIHMDEKNRSIDVQPGVTNLEVQQCAAKHGLFWAPDPTSAAFCSVGGNLAYNSAGPRAVKYGTCRENTLGLRAVTGNGDIIQCGTHTTKGVVGYDLTRLLIGSEGNLALITQATLKLLPLPTAKHTLKASYQSMDAAARAVSNIMAQAVTPCALEFMDKNALDMVRSYSSSELPTNAGAMLMIEVDGHADTIQRESEIIKLASQVEGHIQTDIAQTKEEAHALWQTRKALSPCLRKIAPKKINEDVVVPVSNIPALINALDRLSQTHDIKIVNFGHAGNGNIHVNLLVNPDDKNEMKAAENCLNDVFDLALELNGSLSGEHGVGLEKRNFITKELGKTEIKLMHQIKQVFDKNNILNPGKTLPEM